MRIQKFDDKSSWLMARLGKITGSRLKGVMPKKRGEGKPIGFYELIAERLCIPGQYEEDKEENPLEHGTVNEPLAIERFTAATGKQVDTSLSLWISEIDPNIAVSPDGFISETEAVEVKCLSSARHVEALLTKHVPAKYEYQVLQYFIVNPKLETVYFCLYDPRLKFSDFFYLTITRESQLSRIEETVIAERDVLAEVGRIIGELTAF